MESIPISREGFEHVQAELERLKKERPGVIEAIKEAREEGDLSENAGYDAARERQGMLEAKITFIESRMPIFNIIDLAALGGKKVLFGATVKVYDIDADEEQEYILLGPDEIDYATTNKCISVLSPVGRALLGKVAGDEVAIDIPRGRVNYEVIDVQFNGSVIKKKK